MAYLIYRAIVKNDVDQEMSFFREKGEQAAFGVRQVVPPGPANAAVPAAN